MVGCCLEEEVWMLGRCVVTLGVVLTVAGCFLELAGEAAAAFPIKGGSLT